MSNVRKMFKGLFWLKARRYRRGYSIVRFGVMPGLVAGLVAGVVFFTQTIETQNRVTQLNQLVEHVIATTIRVTAFDGSIAKGDNLVKVLRETGEFPDNMFTTSTDVELTTPFSGATIAIWGVNDDGFVVLLKSLPENVCFSVAQNILQERDALQSLRIGANVAITDDGAVTGGNSYDKGINMVQSGNFATDCVDNAEVAAIYN